MAEPEKSEPETPLLSVEPDNLPEPEMVTEIPPSPPVSDSSHDTERSEAEVAKYRELLDRSIASQDDLQRLVKQGLEIVYQNQKLAVSSIIEVLEMLRPILAELNATTEAMQIVIREADQTTENLGIAVAALVKQRNEEEEWLSEVKARDAEADHPTTDDQE